MAYVRTYYVRTVHVRTPVRTWESRQGVEPVPGRFVDTSTCLCTYTCTRVWHTYVRTRVRTRVPCYEYHSGTIGTIWYHYGTSTQYCNTIMVQVVFVHVYHTGTLAS